jgi:hypothetical protein
MPELFFRPDAAPVAVSVTPADDVAKLVPPLPNVDVELPPIALSIVPLTVVLIELDTDVDVAPQDTPTGQACTTVTEAATMIAAITHLLFFI